MNTVASENRRYLQKSVNPLLEQLVAELMRSTPSDPVGFATRWLEQEGAKVQQRIQGREARRPEGLFSSEDELEGEDGDGVEELGPRTVPPVNVGVRASVSAEAYGEHFKKQDFKPPVYHKSEAKRKQILEALGDSLLFSNLVPSDLSVIADAMKVTPIPADSTVIGQGDHGDEMYLVDEGTLDCFRTNPDGRREKLVTLRKGDVFGELALMYNAPRAASVVSMTQCVLLSLDRLTFNHIVRDAVSQRHDNYVRLLGSVKILEGLSETDRGRLADSVQLRRFPAGAVVITQGDPGNSLYFVVEGECTATRVDPSGRTDSFKHLQGDYFGELALLYDDPRKATVRTDTDSLLAHLDRQTFNRLLGPLQQLMKDNQHRYQ